MVVFLTGFMGSGKSRKGRELAATVQCPFIDIDELIVASVGMSITEYFQLEGERKFRTIESDILRTIPYPSTAVVAVGGGLPCYHENMDWMNKKGTTVYLEMTPAALVSRLKNRAKRPLIKDLNDAQLLVFIEDKLQDRVSFYKTAQVVVDGLHATAETLRRAIGI